MDYPNSTKAKKHYLVLSFDRGYSAPKGLTDPNAPTHGVRADGLGGKDAGKRPKKKKKAAVKSKEWIERKKEVQRRKGGYDVRRDTKFTGRKRKDKF